MKVGDYEYGRSILPFSVKYKKFAKTSSCRPFPSYSTHSTSITQGSVSNLALDWQRGGCEGLPGLFFKKCKVIQFPINKNTLC